MAAIVKLPAARTAARPEAPREAPPETPAAVLAHGARDRFRIRLQGRRADAFLPLAAAEMASSPDIFRIRINRPSSSLIVWVRPGSALDGDGARVAALVSETLGRIARGQRRCAAPVEGANDGGPDLALSLLKAFAF